MTDRDLNQPMAVALGLGSNLGDRSSALAGAIAALTDEGWVVSPRTSSIYETVSIGPAQPRFLNQVLVGETTATPHRLLAECLEIERRLGRRRDGEHWGPRVIDIDLLAVGRETYHSDELTLPHPEIAHRRFVLVPWAEVDAEFRVPPFGDREQERTVAELLADLPDDPRTVVQWDERAETGSR
jgi:2-amino-4-hydroxy-6-hydroxymethyldihydropteridine diphosphokinase